ncbi:hypothetical protein DCO58_08200 [Helicobacter saguini]|uniref:Uncharacterized protein n=1 Tax=Helicobacter saguini TaxID=1548018 RepID=A0A347VNN8_9HELI|nr:hypothetical protein [Helicobacter saguini]MWV61695.1 hypothetical protein [Helicobacter saguini]MWV67633.1 hypothetical protein [Helicobacter saguini]MWV69984.1 hypothetical protein [Helicobacter saguini]MWV72802.1 hypothetical protein [Helicobacter saguini]TLD91991.1 hypothetical protein LS64_011060 [Helicobacter saguini]
MKQDLTFIAIESDLKNIYKQINQIKYSNKIILFSKNNIRFTNHNLCNNLYSYIRNNMFMKSDNATAYFMDMLNKQTLYNNLEYNKEYYVGLLKIQDKGDATQVDNNIYFENTNNNFRQYCKAFFLQPKEQPWNTFINAIKKEFIEAKSLNDVIKTINKDKLSKILQSFEKSLLANINNIQDSQYFTNNILPLAKNSIKDIIQNLYSNIEKSQNKQIGKKFLRTILIVLVNIIDFDTKNLFKSITKKPATIIDSLWTGVSETINMVKSDNEIVYYAIILSLVDLFVSQFAPIVNLCKKYLMNELLFYDNNFIDFSIYNDMIETKLPIQSTFIKGKIESSFIDNLSAIFKEEKTYKNIDSEYNIININDKEYNLKKHISNNIQKLRFFFFAEYTDLNSTKFIEIMKEKALQEQYSSSYKEKGYLFITEAPSVLNAGLTKEVMNVIGLTPQNSTNHKRQQESLSKKHNPNIDYSNYIIKQDNKIFKHIVLQLSLFTKLPDDLAKDYRNYATSFLETKWLKKTYNESLLQELEYIDSFFQTPKDIEEITEKQENFAKEFLKITQDFFDKINENKIYLTKQLTNKIIEENTEYSPQDVISIIVMLYILKNEFDSNTPSSSLSPRNQEFKESFYSNTRWFQTYIIPNYHSLYIFVKNAYININDKKIYIALSKEVEENELKTKQNVLRIYEMIDDICDVKIRNEEKFYTNIFNLLKKSINSLEEKNADIQQLEQEEQKAFNELNKKIPSDIEKHIIQEQINKISIQQIIKQGLFSIIPFASYFDENPNFVGKLIHYFAICIFDKQVKSKSLSDKFTHIVAKELGILAILKFDKTINIYQEKYNTQTLYKLIISTRTLYIQQIISTTQIKTTTTISVHYALNMINKLEFKNLTKDIFKGVGVSMAQGFMVAWIKKEFPLYAEEFKDKYEYIYYKKLRYKYNLPYAVNREEFVTIPMKIYNAYMGFDLHAMVYGSKLCTGGLKYHSGIAYSYTPKSKQLNEAITKDYVIKKLLGYILLDELRGVSKSKNYYINDIDFFANGFNTASVDILKTNKEFYKLRDEKKLQDFKALDGNKEIKAIDCYNKCIDILSDIANNNMNTQHNNNYQAKIKELLENLKIIGQNNIKALYVGINDENLTSKNKVPLPPSNKRTNEQNADSQKPKRPKFIGRLATTIIMEDGLWIG